MSSIYSIMTDLMNAGRKRYGLTEKLSVPALTAYVEAEAATVTESLVPYIEKTATTLEVPDCIENIGDYAFSYYPDLTTVTIPSSVATISSNAFVGCPKLETITCDFYEGDVANAPWGAADTVNIVYKEVSSSSSSSSSSSAPQPSSDALYFMSTTGNIINLSLQVVVGSIINSRSSSSSSESGDISVASTIVIPPVTLGVRVRYRTSNNTSVLQEDYDSEGTYVIPMSGEWVELCSVASSSLLRADSLSIIESNSAKFKVGGTFNLNLNAAAGIFRDLTNLVSARDLSLPLSNNSYASLFSGCINLVDPPALSDTYLSASCYARMFQGCTSLTQAPDLPATTLADRCYEAMFDGCSKLSYISVDFTNWHDTATINWVNGVAADGIFACPASLPDERGVDRIPEGWTVERK